jgi:guanylate kinase
MRLDVQGAATVRRLVPEAVLIFLSAASEEELLARLRRRRTDSEAHLQERIRMAQAEMQRMAEFDYVVVNREDALDEAVQQILAIIVAEHSRVHPRQVRL